MNRRTFLGTVLGLIAYAKSGFAWEHKPRPKSLSLVGPEPTYDLLIWNIGLEYIIIKNKGDSPVELMFLWGRTPNVHYAVTIPSHYCNWLIGPFDPAIYNDSRGYLTIRVPRLQYDQIEIEQVPPWEA